MNRKPTCIMITGRPGSGKTTLARKLGERLWMPVISRDEIKEWYVNTHGLKHDELPANTNGLVSELFFDIVNHYLASNISVVIEAAFQHHVWEPKITKIAELAHVRIILCSVDDEVASRRHLERALQNADRKFYHGERRVAHESYLAPDFDLPTIQVSTDGEYVPGMDAIVEQIRSSLFLTMQQEGSAAH